MPCNHLFCVQWRKLKGMFTISEDENVSLETPKDQVIQVSFLNDKDTSFVINTVNEAPVTSTMKEKKPRTRRPKDVTTPNKPDTSGEKKKAPAAKKEATSAKPRAKKESKNG